MEIKIFTQLSSEQVKFIADSNYNYWKNINPALDYQQSVANICELKNNFDKLPLGIALVENNEILGFCTLRENRLQNHLDINPWLCNVLIFPKWRGLGYAKKMIDFACQKFKTLGYDKIYVWTDQVPEFYEKLNWNFEGKILKNEGQEALLFSKNI